MKNALIVIFGFATIFLCLFIYTKYPIQNAFNQKFVPDVVIDTTFPYGQWAWKYSTDSEGNIVEPANSRDFIITFTPEGRVTSTTDCNTMSGSYVWNEGSMSVGPILITEKVCKKETLESAYITSLSLVSRYSYTNVSGLTLYMSNNLGTMVFEPR